MCDKTSAEIFPVVLFCSFEQCTSQLSTKKFKFFRFDTIIISWTCILTPAYYKLCVSCLHEYLNCA